jgi:hypothetical protein
LYANVKNNNNIIWKNLTVVDLNPINIVNPGGGGWIADAKKTGAVIRVGDAWNRGGVYNLELQNPPTYRGNPVTAEAEVQIILDEPLWRIWETGGYQGTNVAILNATKRQIVVRNSPASLNNLRFRANEQYLAHVSFHFLADKLSGQREFYFQAIQRNTLTKEPVGGEKFHIKIPGRDGFFANAGIDLLVSRYSKVNLKAMDIGEPATYNWYDEAGNLIHSGKELSVSADVTEKYKLEVIAKRDGVKDYDVVEVKVKSHEIVAISPNPANNNVLVKYKLSGAKSAYLILQRPYASIQNQYILNLSQSQTTVNVSGLARGTYSVILVCDGTATDVKSLVVQ